MGTSTGTGFFYDNKGTVVTNYHVIEGCASAEITLANGNSYKVDKVLGYNKNRYIAILSTSNSFVISICFSLFIIFCIINSYNCLINYVIFSN